MAGRVYSERLFHHQAAGTWSFIVPDDMRVIITHVDVLGQAAGAGYIGLRIGPIWLTLIRVPAPDVAYHEVMRAVAYQGEEVALLINLTGIHVTVDGYAFEDTSGRTGPPWPPSFRRLSEPREGDLSLPPP